MRSPLVCELLNSTIAHHPQKHPKFFGSVVKVILVSFCPLDDDVIANIKSVLDTCTGTREYHNRKLPCNSLPPSQRDLSHRDFANVTHLSLFFYGRLHGWNWDSLVSLRHLTHLLMGLHLDCAIHPITALCRASSTLRLLILTKLYTDRSLLEQETRQLSDVDI